MLLAKNAFPEHHARKGSSADCARSRPYRKGRSSRCSIGRLPGLDPRRVRFLSRRRHSDRNSQRISSAGSRYRFHHCDYARVSAGRRIYLRLACGPVRTAIAFDTGSDFLFNRRSAIGPGAKLRHFPGAAGTLRHRHGPRVGRSRLGGHGESSAAFAGRVVRVAARRLRGGIFTGCHLFFDCAAAVGLATDVLHWWVAGAVSVICAREGEGIRGVEGNSPRKLERPRPWHRFALEAVRLSDTIDDDDELHLPWNAGHVSNFLGALLGIRSGAANDGNCDLDGWRYYRRPLFWILVRSFRSSSGDDWRVAMRHSGD